MNDITIAERRAIADRVATAPEFRELLGREPREAIATVVGRPVTGDLTVSLVEEQGEAWEFVVPSGGIETSLDAATDARGAIENQVYAILRDEPDLRGTMIENPKGFLRTRLDFEMSAPLNLRVEQPGELVLVLPYRDARDELDESLLDLVAGGAVPPCQGDLAGSKADRG